jgi:hypothetical protein
MQLIQGQIGLAAGEANIMDYAVIPDPVNQHDQVSVPFLMPCCILHWNKLFIHHQTRKVNCFSGLFSLEFATIRGSSFYEVV